MQFGVRVKFILILVIAAVMPLLIGLLAIQRIGSQYVEREKGILFQTTAEHVADGLGDVIRHPVSSLCDFLAYSDVRDLLAQMQEADSGDVDALEARWPGLGPNAPEIRAVLDNALAQRLLDLQTDHTLFVELFITDAVGRLVAASNKTSDFWQADEVWWQQAVAQPPGGVWLEGISYDESAAVYGLDVAVAIWDRNAPNPRLLGVVKAVLDASPLLQSMRNAPRPGRPDIHIVLEDGRVLTSLFGQPVSPLSISVSTEMQGQFASQPSGWGVNRVLSEGGQLVGFAVVEASGGGADPKITFGLQPMYVIAHGDIDAILHPVHRQALALSLIAVAVVLGFSIIGYYIAERRILRPVYLIRSAAQGIASAARLEGAAPNGAGRSQSALDGLSPEELVQRVDDLETHDEFQDLAGDFVLMARRVLRYHEQLEKEIKLKTEEIARDRRLARDFQEALLPRRYPRIPENTQHAAFSLRFAHSYTPALSVSGDFFDVTKLTDYRAGIFIADVMGHGARSALATSILRTLFQNLFALAEDPARLLKEINGAFYSALPNEDDCIFATAFYMVLDTLHGSISYATAGHTVPLVLRRSSGVAEDLVPPEGNNCALGLFAESDYSVCTQPVRTGDTFVLFTDGVEEAENPARDPFGRDRIRDALAGRMPATAVELTDALIDALNRHMDTVVAVDDICVITVETVDPNAEDRQTAGSDAVEAPVESEHG